MKVEYIKKAREFRPYNITIETEEDEDGLREILLHCDSGSLGVRVFASDINIAINTIEKGIRNFLMEYKEGRTNEHKHRNRKKV